MTDKTVNYTKEATADLVERYTAVKTDADRKAVVEAVAKELGKTVASVRAKLVREKVYVAVTRVGKRKAKKAELIAALAKTMGVNEDAIGSLEKATAAAILKVIGAVGKAKREAE